MIISTSATSIINIIIINNMHKYNKQGNSLVESYSTKFVHSQQTLLKSVSPHMCNKVLCIGMIHTLKTDSLTIATSYQTGGFQQIVVTLQNNSPKIINGQKLMNFLCLYQRVLGTVSAIFWLLWKHHRQATMVAWDAFFLFPCKMYMQKRHEYKKGKNSTETQTEILKTVIRLQRICIRALTSSKALKTTNTVLTNVIVSPYKHWCQHCLQTVCSHFSIRKDEIVTKQKRKDRALLTEEVYDSSFSWMFVKSRNEEKLNEHKLPHGPTSANSSRTQSTSRPIRNEFIRTWLFPHKNKQHTFWHSNSIPQVSLSIIVFKE